MGCWHAIQEQLMTFKKVSVAASTFALGSISLGLEPLFQILDAERRSVKQLTFDLLDDSI